MTRRDWVAERWLLRFLRVAGFATVGDETFEAAVRAGGAADLASAAEAMAALLRLGLLARTGPIVTLTREGERAADSAARFAESLGEPRVALPESRLPAIVMAEADYETVDSAPEGSMLPPSPGKEKTMKDFLSPALERFSLDDPDAGRKLLENLDVRKVRLAFSELCWHFRCGDYDDKMRLRAFLLDLSMGGGLVEVLPNLYCRPALTGGASGADAVKRAASEIEKIRKARPKKDVARRDAEAAAMRAFLRSKGGRATRADVIAEAGRLGWDVGRATYIIQHLREIGAIASAGHGAYRLQDDEAEAGKTGDAADDA